MVTILEQSDDKKMGILTMSVSVSLLSSGCCHCSHVVRTVLERSSDREMLPLCASSVTFFASACILQAKTVGFHEVNGTPIMSS